MGISWSNRRRNNGYYPHPYPPPPPPPNYYSTEPLSLPLPPPPPPHQNYYSTAAAQQPSYPQSHNPYPAPPPPPVHSHYASHPYNSCGYANHMAGRFNYHQPYYSNGRIGPNVGTSQPLQLAPFVEHQNAKKVRNDVNLHKESLRVEIDEQNPDHHLVSFVFDALFDGSITIFYFAKEESNCRFVPLFPEAHLPVKIPFQKGPGQKFRQPSGTGVDLGFFELDDLAKPSPEEDSFPLVIVAETRLPDHSTDEHVDDSVSNTSTHMQITEAVLEKKHGEPFQVKVIKQILWIDGVRYELRDLYGIGSAVEGFDDSDPGKECVICMTEPKDTAVLPCRHMCMCSDCAKQLRLQSNKCPICRTPIDELIEIKINSRGC